jgi:hypothetical protein
MDPINTANELVVRQPRIREFAPTSARVLPSRVCASVRRASTGYRSAWATPRLQPPDIRRCKIVRDWAPAEFVAGGDVYGRRPFVAPVVFFLVDAKTTSEIAEIKGFFSALDDADDNATFMTRLLLLLSDFGG